MREGEGKRGETRIVTGAHRVGRKRRKTAAAERTPARKSGGLGAIRRGLLGGEGRGGRGLRVGMNGSSIGVVIRPESRWEETAT